VADGNSLECCCGWYTKPEQFGWVQTSQLSLCDDSQPSLPVRAWRTRDTVVSSMEGQEEAARHGMGQAVAVPVRAGDSVVAVLEFFMRERRVGDERLLTLLKALVLGVGSLIEKRRATEELARLHRQREAILRSVAEGICGADREGRATFMNVAAERLLGWTWAEVNGRDIHELLHSCHGEGSSPRQECPIRQALHTGREARGEATFWRRDGTPLRVHYACLVVQDEAPSTACVLTFREITSNENAAHVPKSKKSTRRGVRSQAVSKVG